MSLLLNLNELKRSVIDFMFGRRSGIPLIYFEEKKKKITKITK